MRTPVVAATAALLLLTTACGGEDSPTPEPTSSTPTLSSLDDEQVQRYLPGEGQVPGQWSVVDGDPDAGGELTTLPKACSDMLLSGRVAEDLRPERTGAARRTYLPGEEDGAIGVKMTSYRTAVPDDVFTAMGDALDQCGEYQQVTKNGAVTYLAEGATGPSYGDRTFRVRMREKDSDKVVERVIFSVGSVIVQVIEMHEGGDSVRTGGLETTARAAESNLRDGPREAQAPQESPDVSPGF
ncbi:hypothetical protein AWH69_03735 [Janibacter melonis]|uniref:PknH-like extracellular domain-containing protein n=1 Tax=Janibacter melonis TaxID=262209 RepID=A0A176QGN7_9MICO|nr:hypothetical protein [Janibacter melonis]MBD5831166.1 hypothetical protein [Janibacter melonis]OAB88889.1 hypothetical protein AWH69_03735 [Janibacter melonis]